MHDVPADLAAEALKRVRDQSETPGRKPWPLKSWPDVPTRFLLCRDDRFFPAEWMRRVVRDRLGITPNEIDSGHCPMLSRPAEHRFMWLLVHPGGWEAFEEADARYFASPERKAFDPDPARLIEEQRNVR